MTWMNNILIDNRYRHIFFIDASSTATIRGDLESAIRTINGHEQDTYEGALAFMSRSLEGGEWLYILDNADDHDLNLFPYLPSCSHGTIIITSRNRSMGTLSTTHHLELGPMQEQEAVETLCLAARRSIPLVETESAQAIHLVKVLGCLALAIVQAGIYIHKMSSGQDGGFSFAQYSSLHERHRDKLLRQEGHLSLDQYPHGVYTTLDISYTRLPESCREFLHLCSFFRHTDIAASVFSSAATTNFEDSWKLERRPPDYQNIQIRLRQLFSRNGEWDELLFHKLVQTLSSFSLLSISSVHDVLLLRLHPLVHSHARDKLTAEELPLYRQMAITCISSGYNTLPPNTCQFVFPHCIRIHEESGQDSIHVNDMIRFGELMNRQGSYWEAEKVFKRIADMLIRTQGPDGEDTHLVLSRLASTLWNQGTWSEAEALQRDVLANRQKILKLDHPHIIDASASLAAILRAQGKWSEAEALQREVLTKRQKILGLEHPDTIMASGNLAATLRALGKWSEAEALQRDALNTSQKILGLDHPNTINASGNLATTFRAQGKWSEAEALQRDILVKRQKTLGLDHPNTIATSGNLAATLRAQGKWSEAEARERDALATYQKTLGPDHPNTIAASANLAATLRFQGKWSEAETLERDVIAMSQKILGLDHPDTIMASGNLACTFCAQGKWSDAEALQRDVLAKRQKILGLEHPDTITASANLAGTFRVQGRLNEAEVMLREVLVMRQNALGIEHPESIEALHNFASLLYAKGQRGEAFPLSFQATQLAEKVLGLNHPNIVNYLELLARCYETAGRLEEASSVRKKLDLIHNSH
jgi:tetratricopeptide (TPR) repeat protein